MRENLTIYIVEDDPSVRDSLALTLGLEGYRVGLYADAEAFLAARREEWTGCVIADLRLPGASGIELQATLRAQGSALPVIIITGHGDVPTARKAFQLAAIRTAFALEDRRIKLADACSDKVRKLALLTSREREVLDHAGKGLHAKEIAKALGISARTVEVHKARIMGKLGARNVAELVRFALAAEEPPDAK